METWLTAFQPQVWLKRTLIADCMPWNRTSCNTRPRNQIVKLTVTNRSKSRPGQVAGSNFLPPLQAFADGLPKTATTTHKGMGQGSLAFACLVSCLCVCVVFVCLTAASWERSLRTEFETHVQQQHTNYCYCFGCCQVML